MEEEGEGEALRNHCRRMISLLRNKQQQPEFSEEEEEEKLKHKGARGRERTECERQVVAWDELRERKLPLSGCSEREREQTSLSLLCQGPEVRPVPPQLIPMLRLKTFKEQMRRAAEVELHDPAVCSVCEQEQAQLALKSFIKRKKTQLQFQTLKSLCHLSQSPSMPLAGFGRNYSVEICGSQQPGVALATTEERGVALATDEMRGYPDKNATGTHSASPHCPFSDR
ncbi:uncharacterized protein LOC118333257 isoform X2 [Morone saxatilis]|uniref:uncharacterized protein LOC118333257 isoform X2 n=1 Tax=Morone saxatilis TaxID=34816 RepID=UPI0015E1FC0C|nr:uncharacterized protein LOC118333257 isoform X2 [Morone saxatilis]